MQKRLNSWARRHERVFLTTFLGVCLLVLALVVVDGFRDGDHTVRIAIAAVVEGGLFASIAHQVVLWRRGGLIIHDREARERNRARKVKAPSSPHFSDPCYSATRPC